jgi:CRISPR-associated protein Cas1
MQLYIYEPSSKVGFSDGRVTVKYDDETDRSIPAESVESISLFGPADISSQCVRECLERGIDVQFYSTKGSYYGKLNSTRHVNVSRQRKQAALYQDDAFRLSLAKLIVQSIQC